MSTTLNRTSTKEDEYPKNTAGYLNKDGEEDRTKIIDSSENKENLELPDVMATNELGTMEQDLNDRYQQESLKNLQECFHAGRSNVSINENLIDKEEKCKDESAKDQQKDAAIQEIKKLENAQAAAFSSALKQSLSLNPSFERILQERDQYKEEAMMQAKLLGDLLQQHLTFMGKEKIYEECVRRFHEEQQSAENISDMLHKQYRTLQIEAEQRIIEINDEIEKLHKQHNDAMVPLKFKYRQQELKIKSLESQAEALKTERKELLDMCDALVARYERLNDMNAKTE